MLLKPISLAFRQNKQTPLPFKVLLDLRLAFKRKIFDLPRSITQPARRCLYSWFYYSYSEGQPMKTRVETMKARSGQNHIKLHRKSILIRQLQQMLWTCCVFLSSLNNTFFSVLVIIFSSKSYFCFNYRNTFFIHAMNYFSVVLRIIFLMCIKNYFLIGPRIIFRGMGRVYMANLFFGLRCIAGLAFEV